MIRLAEVVEGYLWATRRTQTNLAKELGISKPTLSRFLTDGKDMSQANLATMLRWLLEDANG